MAVGDKDLQRDLSSLLQQQGKLLSHFPLACVGKFGLSECLYPAYSQGCVARHDFSEADAIGSLLQSGLHFESRLV